jgi:hypothetical protein
METLMPNRDGTPTAYELEFDAAAADVHSPWLPPQPVADNEASETRGVVEDTLTERGKNYGDFTDNSLIAQQIKSGYRASIKYASLDFYMREALEMIASKIGRLLSGDPYHVDGWHDIAGYATLEEQRSKQRSKR